MRYKTSVLALGLLLSFLVGSASASVSKYRWRKVPITISVSTSLTSRPPNISVNSDVSGAIDRALASWQQAAAVSFKRVSSTEQSVDSGAQGDGISLLTVAATQENVSLFPRGLDDATARTKLFYDIRGSITEADIVLNPYLQFSTDGTFGTYDLESILTHELGHLLGLDHSPVIGATMSDNYGRNGIYNLPAFSARTLASDDIAAVRSIYGPADADEDCCGRINGRLSFGAAKPASGYTVWVENIDDGRVIAATTVSIDGSFRLGGLPVDKFRLFAQGDSESHSSVVDLGEVAVSAKQATVVNKRLDKVLGDVRFDYLGFNGQLSGMSVTVNSGSSYFLLAGSSELGSDPVVESRSEFILIQPRTYPAVFSKSIRTLGFDAAIASNAPAGEYSISLRSASGGSRVLLGCVSVEKFQNLWSSTTFR